MTLVTNHDYETLVIGGGPAGLSAALQLARYYRRVALFDAGQGRSTWHQTAHDYLGFPGGVPTLHLRELGRRQLDDYELVDCLDHKIERLTRAGDWFVAAGQAGEWRGRTVILATGVVDHFPHFDGWDACVGRTLFWCITCDGYACRGECVVVAGNTDTAAAEALQLTRFTDRLTLLTNSDECHISERFQRRLERAGIPLLHDRLADVVAEDGHVRTLLTDGGRELALDQLFVVQGATPQNELARDLGLALAEQGYVIIDTEQQTNVPGVYAAGDVTKLFDQTVAAAVHEGLQAASAANYYLYPPDLKDD